jgi:hypothetical protein
MLFLLLALLPLDLHAGAAASQGTPLVVTLELGPVAGATHYRITNRYSGQGARRFVTGATDRNCEDPIDVLLVDDKVERLYSLLPCGGFAFRSTRRVAPSEQWVIEGTVMLPAGTRGVVARYCPKSEDLGSIAPAERNKKGDPGWFGCVDSAPVPPPAVSSGTASGSAPLAAILVRGSASPEQAWARLLAALSAADSGAIARATTPAGLSSLRAGVKGEPEGTAFARWGRGWGGWQVRWKSRTLTRAEAALGPSVKEHGLVFVHAGDGWRLERWTPGE